MHAKVSIMRKLYDKFISALEWLLDALEVEGKALFQFFCIFPVAILGTQISMVIFTDGGGLGEKFFFKILCASLIPVVGVPFLRVFLSGIVRQENEEDRVDPGMWSLATAGLFILIVILLTGVVGCAGTSQEVKSTSFNSESYNAEVDLWVEEAEEARHLEWMLRFHKLELDDCVESALACETHAHKGYCGSHQKEIDKLLNEARYFFWHECSRRPIPTYCVQLEEAMK